MQKVKNINKYQSPWSTLPMNTIYGGMRLGTNGEYHFLNNDELKEYDGITENERKELENSRLTNQIRTQNEIDRQKRIDVAKERQSVENTADAKSTRMFQAMNSGEFSDFDYDSNTKLLNQINTNYSVPSTYHLNKKDTSDLFNSKYTTSTAVNGAKSFGASLMALGLPAMANGLINPATMWKTLPIFKNTALPTLATMIGGFAGAAPAATAGSYLGGRLFGEVGSAWGEQFGGLLGGSAGGLITSKLAPVKLGFMKGKAYDTFGTNEKNVLKNNKLQWTYSPKSKYTTNGKIATKLFPKEEELAHEFGHWMGDRLSENGFTKGIYAPEYSYSSTSDAILNTIEHYADRFKTQLGYQYKGKDPQLIARQNAVNKYLDQEPILLDVPKPNEDLNYGPKYNPDKEVKWFKDGPYQLDDSPSFQTYREIDIETVPPNLIPKEFLVYKKKVPYIKVNRNGKQVLVPLPKENVTGDLVQRENGFDRMIHGENADSIANAMNERIREWKQSPEYLQQAAEELMPSGLDLQTAVKSLADTSPELFRAYIANDPQAVKVVEYLWKIRNGQFRMPEVDIDGNVRVLGGPVSNDEIILPNVVGDSYPPSLLTYIKAAIENPSTASKIADILTGVKGVTPMEGRTTFEEGVVAQRPKNYIPSEKFRGQYVTNNMPVGLFYGKHGLSRAGATPSAQDWFYDLIDSQQNWTSDAKIEAKKLVDIIENGLKDMNNGKKGRANPLWSRDETKNPVFLKAPLPQDFNFPGDLSTGKLVEAKVAKRIEIENAINKLGSMLGNKNIGGVLELFCAYPKEGTPIIDYKGNWWKHVDLDGYPTAYGLTGDGPVPPSWKYANGSNPTFKNIDEFTHTLSDDQVGIIRNIIDAINGPIGTDMNFGKNVFRTQKHGGILKRVR